MLLSFPSGPHSGQLFNTILSVALESVYLSLSRLHPTLLHKIYSRRCFFATPDRKCAGVPHRMIKGREECLLSDERSGLADKPHLRVIDEWSYPQIRYNPEGQVIRRFEVLVGIFQGIERF